MSTLDRRVPVECYAVMRKLNTFSLELSELKRWATGRCSRLVPSVLLKMMRDHTSCATLRQVQKRFTCKSATTAGSRTTESTGLLDIGALDQIHVPLHRVWELLWPHIQDRCPCSVLSVAMGSRASSPWCPSASWIITTHVEDHDAVLLSVRRGTPLFFWVEKICQKSVPGRNYVKRIVLCWVVLK